MDDLVFRSARHTSGNPVDLVFGAEESIPFDNTISFNSIVPTVRSVSVQLVERFQIEFSIALPLPHVVAVNIAYDNAVSRGPQSRTQTNWELGSRRLQTFEAPHAPATALKPFRRAPWTSGTPLNPNRSTAWTESTRRPVVAIALWTEATRLSGAAATTWQAATRTAVDRKAPWQESTRRAGDARRLVWQEMTHSSRIARVMPWQEATHQEKTWSFPWSVAVHRGFSRKAPWQEAHHPLPGRSIITPPVIPPEDPCYVPPHGLAVDLFFKELWHAHTDLYFTCDLHPPINPPLVVVPVRSVYMIVNNTSLRRVSDNAVVPTQGMTLSIDVDSWTWSFAASVPGYSLAMLEPTAGVPVVLKANINGVDYHVLCENIERDRVFSRSDLRISGRGKSAALDAPFSPVLSLFNEEARTAQQLMNDALLDNGEPIGWDVEWNLTDWLVPAGAWSFQGSRIEAINRIAAAAGGYVQPHETEEKLIILPKYPVAPWNWVADAVPDFELPSALMSRESISWRQKVEYNRVFISGSAIGGVLGQVTRAGTDGSIVAPMVTDALMTHVDAIRQRGTTILSDTGRQAFVSLRMPVHPLTGVIKPGKFVKYVDGGTTRLGIVRSTGVEVGEASVWQTLGVETHV